MFKNIKTREDLQEELRKKQEILELQQFRYKREKLVSENIVTTTTNKTFHADEKSIIKLGNSIIKHMTLPEDYIIKWSTADVGTGVMVDCTYAEIKEAHRLAVEFVEQVWSIE